MPRDGFEPHLSVGDATIDRRDVEMLRAIDRCGSMQAAAEDLERSYPHLQRRLVEIEDAAGPLTERVRGGRDGGGTELTERATRLLRRFDRLRAELGGVTAVTESVLPGTVTDRDGELATVSTPAGEVTARVPEGAGEVEVSVRSDAVVLLASDPDERPPAAGTSMRNRFEGRVRRIERDGAVAHVTVAVGGGVDLEAMITRTSLSRLALSEGCDVVAAFKSTAARGIDVEP